MEKRAGTRASKKKKKKVDDGIGNPYPSTIIACSMSDTVQHIPINSSLLIVRNSKVGISTVTCSCCGHKALFT